jgi:GDPmannose 4,6-dehydratase
MAMWLMLQQDKPDDYVVATGQMHSVREFVEASFRLVGLDSSTRVVYNDPQFVRPSEVDQLCGRPVKAREVLGWTPRTTFDELVEIMVGHDIAALTR